MLSGVLSLQVGPWDRPAVSINSVTSMTLWMWVDHGKLWKTTFNCARNHDTAPLLGVTKEVFPAAFLAKLLSRALRLHQDASLTLWQMCELSKRLGMLYMPLASASALLSRTKQRQDAHRPVSRMRGCRFSVRLFLSAQSTGLPSCKITMRHNIRAVH